MKKNDLLNSPRLSKLKRQRQRVVRIKTLLALVALLVIFFSLSYIARTPDLNIWQIEVRGNKVIDAKIIEEIVEQEIAGNYLWAFPRTNILIYPKSRIKNELVNTFKRIGEVDINVRNKKVLVIEVLERVALYTWCGENPDLRPESEDDNTNAEKCYFVDKDGYIFDEAPYFSGEIYFKFYGPSVGVGSHFHTKDFHRLVELIKTLEGMNLRPVALLALANNDIKVFLSRGAVPAGGPEVILKIDSDFEKIAENLEVALTAEPLKSDFVDKYSSLQYIDLRFGNKVYYKFLEI